MMIFFIGLWLAGCLKKSGMSGTSASRKIELESLIRGIDQTMPEIDAEIAKHLANVQKMKDRLKKARETGTTPDISGLKVYADAAGGRTEAYHKSKTWKKELIDKLEDMELFNALDASRLAAATVNGNVEEVFISNEINRSQRFITMLQVHRKRQEEARAKAEDELQRINDELARSSTTIIDDETEKGGDGGDGGNGGGY